MGTKEFILSIVGAMAFPISWVYICFVLRKMIMLYNGKTSGYLYLSCESAKDYNKYKKARAKAKKQLKQLVITDLPI